MEIYIPYVIRMELQLPGCNRSDENQENNYDVLTC